MIKLSFLTILALVLTGCASPISPQDLEGEKGSYFTFEVTGSTAATVFRRITERSRSCLVIGNASITTDHFPDLQESRVTLMIIPSVTESVTTIRPSGSDSSTVRVLFRDRSQNGNHTPWVASIEDWANGRPGVCLVENINRPKIDKEVSP